MGKSIFDGRVQIKYSYGCYGMTRGGGKTWHGGMDIVGVDSDIILMPYYEMPDGTQKPIKGRVTRARIVTDHSDRTWEWGYYVCVQLDADQTPDAVNFMYFCHCARLLVDVGDRVISGQQLAIMGETGNAEGTHPHCHFEVRATASGKGLDPTAYAAIPNKAGWVLFGREPSSKVVEVFNDYDAELVNIYRCIKYHSDALQHELDLLPDAREVFFDCLAQEQVRGLTDIQRAARSLYLIKASFGTNRHTFATAPKGVCNISASFPAVQERLRRVIIENLDFEHLIKTYDRENALFYCDPPYFETEKYYRARFQESDHKRLADALHSIKGRFLLSYNDCPQVRELYADCIIEPVSRRNTLSAQSADGYKEVLVRNYEL